MPQVQPSLAVVITTFRRPDSLAVTLASLLEQDVPELEIVVVDNAPEGGAEAALTGLPGRPGYSLRVVRHPCGGNSGARNRGVAESRGEVVLFSDDDLTFAPGWAGAYARAFAEHPDLDAATGRVRPHWLAEPPAWVLRLLEERPSWPVLALQDLGEAFRRDPGVFLYGCNMAIRRRVFERTGFRPEIFGPRTLGNGESGLCWELQRAGSAMGYVPGAEARHRIPAGRLTPAYVRRWAGGHQSGSLMYERLRGRALTPARLAREVAAAFKRHLPRALGGLLAWGRTSPRAVDLQFAAARLGGDLRYLYWAATEPKVRALLAIDDFRPATDPEASWRGQQDTPPELRL